MSKGKEKPQHVTSFSKSRGSDAIEVRYTVVFVCHQSSSCPVYKPIRYRTPSSPIYLSEVTEHALRFIASIPLIQRRKKCCFREEKSAFTQWFFSVYARSLTDQVRQSKYPRTQILEPRTQSILICHSSVTFIPTRSNNLIEITSQIHIAFSPKLYSFLHHPIQLYPRTHIGHRADLYRFILSSYERRQAF